MSDRKRVTSFYMLKRESTCRAAADSAAVAAAAAAVGAAVEGLVPYDAPPLGGALTGSACLGTVLCSTHQGVSRKTRTARITGGPKSIHGLATSLQAARSLQTTGYNQQ